MKMMEVQTLRRAGLEQALKALMRNMHTFYIHFSLSAHQLALEM
jgi:hypothetical protein